MPKLKRPWPAVHYFLHLPVYANSKAIVIDELAGSLSAQQGFALRVAGYYRGQCLIIMLLINATPALNGLADQLPRKRFL
jgi:hypothetical protein